MGGKTSGVGSESTIRAKGMTSGWAVRCAPHLRDYKTLDLLKCIFCIQATDVDLDAAVLPDATTTSGVSDVDASPSHMNELSLIAD